MKPHSSYPMLSSKPSNKYLLRALSPQTDIDLFRQAYSWRRKPKSKVRLGRMTFEDFAADDPRQIVLGLFNGELQAAYLLRETQPAVYECHFTSKRDAPKDAVLAGARWISDYFTDNGLTLTAQVLRKNKALCRFSEAIGLVVQSEVNGIVYYLRLSDTACSNLNP